VSIETTIRAQLCELSQLLANRGMVSIAAGALSSRLDIKRFLATPPGVSLSLLRPEQLKAHDLSAPNTKATELHRVIYQTRSDIKAVVWARPTTTTALLMAGISPAQCLLPFSMGALEGESEPTLFSSQRLLEMVRRFDVITLERFGVLSLGSSPEEAFARVEALEQCSQITQATRSFTMAQLPKAQLDHKIVLGNTLQLSQQRECTGCGGCGQSKSNSESEAALAAKVAATFAQKPKSDEPIPFVLPPGRRATCGEAWWLEPETK
jgi:ribulose-5-phosphate 4-epimerase/fuculose-1-phosphate aldolase